MMPHNIVINAEKQGIILYLKDGNLAFKAIGNKLSDELRQQLRASKDDIVELLKTHSKFAIELMHYRDQRLQLDAELPLSFSQQRLWFIEQLEGPSGQYNISASYYLSGDVNIDAMRQAFVALIQRHEVMSTLYKVDDAQQAYQQHLPITDFDLTVEDFRDVPEQQRHAAVLKYINAQADHAFDLANDVLLRAALIRVADDKCVLAMTTHHIASDGWSVGVMTNDLFAYYQGFAADTNQSADAVLPAPAFQYADYALWQREQFDDSKIQQSLDFWKQQLAGIPEVHSVATDFERPAQPSYQGARFYQHISRDVADQLVQQTRRVGASAFMGLHAAFSAFLSLVSGEDDIVIGTPTANRDEEELADIIGFFVNTLVLRSHIDDNSSFESLLAQSRDYMLAAHEHQQIPFDKLVNELAPSRSLSYAPVFQLMMTFHNYQQVNQLEASSLSVERLDQDALVVKYDLILDIIEDDRGFHITWEYATDLFAESRIQGLASLFSDFLTVCLANPTQQLSQLALVNAEQHNQLVNTLNQTACAYPHEQTIGSQFAAQLAANPNHTALVFEDQTLSYAELDRRSNQVANYLLEQGIGCAAGTAEAVDACVGLVMHRSVELVVNILGVLKTGAAYVPIDPDYPAARLAYVIGDVQPKAVLIGGTISDEVAQQVTQSAASFCDAKAFADIDFDAQSSSAVAQDAVNAASLAYVIYTSGTTGQPKGVMIEQGSLINRVHWMQKQYQLSAQSKVLQKTPYSFDVSVWEFIWPLTYGATLVLAKPEGHKDPAYLADLIQAQQITHLHFVPSMLNVMLATGLWQQCNSVEKVFCSGEALTGDTRNRFFATGTQSELHNLYGPTEAAIDVTYFPCDAQQTSAQVPIGKPIDNTQLFILNTQQQLVPFGVAGELYLGGVGLARGYRNKPEMTAERFIDNPFGEGRLYRTGDKARYLPDGNVQYLGRLDQQVKLRGFRIELGEIEAALLKQASIVEAAVMVDSDSENLVAYVVNGAENSATENATEQHEASQSVSAQVELSSEYLAELRAALAELLPEFMLPQAIIGLNALPLTANGKLDRRSLPKADFSAEKTAYVAPSNEQEATLCEIFQNILSLEQVGVHDNFFALGGHSLLVMQVIGDAQKAGYSLQVRDVFATPTPHGLAKCLANPAEQNQWQVPANLITATTTQLTPELLPLAELTQAEIDTLVANVPGGASNVQDIYPLAPLQEGILFHHMMEQSAADIYVLPLLFKAKDDASLQQIIDALQYCVQRHDVLRTSIHWQNLSTPMQVVMRSADLPVTQLSQADISGESMNAHMQWLSEVEQQVMDLTKGPLLQLTVAPTDELMAGENREHWVLLQLHHIVSDHVGLSLLQDEVTAFITGEPSPVQATPYREFVGRIRAQMQENDADAFFTDMLGEVSEPTTPFNLVSEEGGVNRIVETHTPLSSELSLAIRTLAKQQQLSPAAIFHAAWAVVVAVCSGRNDVVFGTVMSGRLQSDPSAAAMLGMFINTVPMRVSYSAETTVQQLLLATQKALFDLVPYEQSSLVKAQQCSQVPRDLPLFSALLNYRHGSEAIDNSDQQADAPLQLVAGQERTNYPFNLSVDDLGEGFELTWQLDAQVDSDAVTQYMLKALTQLVGAGSTPMSHVVLVDEAKVEASSVKEPTAENAPIWHSQSMSERFADMVQQYPNNTAVSLNDESLSYTQLDQQSSQLAAYLQQQGVNVGDNVAISLPRCIDLVIAVVAAVKLGAAYVPIDPEYPAARIEYMLQDSQPKLVLTHAALAERFSATPVIALDDTSHWCATHADAFKAQATSPKDLAYIIYTSGSTGQPKGVLVNQMGALRLVCPANFMRLDETTRFLQTAPIAFDASVLEIWGSLLNGGCCVLYPSDTMDLSKLNDSVINEQLTDVWLTTGLFDAWSESLSEATAAQFNHLRVILCGGDMANPAAFRRMQQLLPNVTIVHCYGPTENSTFTTCHPITADMPIEAVVPIASAVNGVVNGGTLAIMNGAMQRLPQGVAGELYLGGDGLARGYLNKPERTAESFVQNPVGAGMLYRTGDLVRFNDAGELCFVGRVDNQVKVRGYRIELSEVETQLNDLPMLERAAVVVRELAQGGKQLVAYLEASETAKEPASTLLSQVQHALAAVLPSYMQPTVWQWVEGWTLTANGKIDRRALPEPTQVDQSSAVVAPSNETESTLRALWANLLQLPADSISCDANFFSLGGDSILSIQLVSRAGREGLYFSVKQLFDHPTIAGLASQVTTEQQQAIVQTPVEGAMPLLPIQQKFLNANVGLQHFNQSVVLQTPDSFKADYLPALAKALMTRHDALRLSFALQGEQWQAQHLPLTDAMIESVITEINLGEQSMSDSLTAKADELQASLNIENGPLWRLAYFSNAAGEGRLLWVVHHLVVDGVSWRILLQDAEQALQQLLAQKTIELAPKTSAYQAWGEWLHSFSSDAALAQERDYWLQQPWQSATAIKATATEEDMRPASQRVNNLEFALDPAQTKALLQQAGSTYRTQINELLLSAVYIALRDWQPELAGVCLDLEAHGREALTLQNPATSAPNISETVGWFTTIYPLLLSTTSTDIGDVICTVKEQYRAVPNNGVGFGVLQYLAKSPELLALPASGVGFNYLGQFDQVVNNDTLLTPAVESSGNEASDAHGLSHPLFVTAMVSAGQMQFTLQFDSATHSAASVAQLQAKLQHSLAALITHCVDQLAEAGQGRFTPSDFPLANFTNESLLQRDASAETSAQALEDQFQALQQLTDSYSLQDVYPATAMQTGLLFHSDMDSSAYVTQMVMYISNLDVQRFQQSWQQVIARYDILRTAFVDLSAGLHQVVSDKVELPWQLIDLRGMDEQQQKHQVEALRAQQKSNGFDRRSPTLMRFMLCQLGAQKYAVIWSHHHALMDGWCLSLLFTEVMSIYREGEQAKLADVPQYRRYIQWLDGKTTDAAKQFWKTRLAEVDTGTQLPTALFDTLPAGKLSHEISATDTDALRALAQRHQVTLNTLVQVAWGELLTRYTQQQTVVFGSVVSGRPAELSDVENMVGLFINTLPVVFNSNDASVAQLLKNTHSRHVEADSYSYLPLVEIQQQSAVRDLFDSIVVFENYPIAEELTSKEVEEDLFNVDAVDSFEGTNFGLSLIVHAEQSLQFSLEYQGERFEAMHIENMLTHLSNLLLAMLQDDAQAVQTLPMLSAAEQRALTVDGVSPLAQTEVSQTIAATFAEQAQQTPDNVALIFDAEQLTYAQLEQRSNQLANYLVAQGVQRETLVALALPRSLDMVVSVLAILKAGGAYVPLDPNYPQSRIDYVLNDSQPQLLLTTEALSDKFAGHTVPAVDALTLDCSNFSNVAPVVANAQPTDLAYVIYTSGSTGNPKGVLQTQENVIRLFSATHSHFGFNSDDVWPLFHSIAFDVSVWELWGALFHGGTLVIPDQATTRDAKAFVRLCAQHNVSILAQTPSAFDVFAQAALADHVPLPSLRFVTFGGEAVYTEKLQAWWQHYGESQPRLVNLYGITETMVHATIKDLSPSEQKGSVIGKRIADQALYLLDRHLQPVPKGCVGEIYVGGAGVARGYLNLPEMTAERFIDNPYATEQMHTRGLTRLYKSGDLARLDADGELIYYGRNDDQVKVRGFRIELGEVERQIGLDDLVAAAVVTVNELASGDKQLVAYVEPEAQVAAMAEAEFTQVLLASLAERLPEYMLPNRFLVMQEWPLTTNGKIDRRALPKLDDVAFTEDYIAPETESEQRLVSIWAQLLNLPADKIGRRANFFALGGHSLLVTKLVIQLKTHWDLELEIAQVFELDSLQELAAFLDAQKASQQKQAALSAELDAADEEDIFEIDI